jgi:hypothetical protein
MVELEESEKDYIKGLSTEYKRIHKEIKEVEDLMKEFSERAKTLIKELEEKRENEMGFLDSLREKYGEGYIDVFTLRWMKGKK